MKTYENLRGKRADVRGAKSEPIKFSLLSPMAFPLIFPSPPFYLLALCQAGSFIRFCRASSRGCTSSYLHVPLSRREGENQQRPKFSKSKPNPTRVDRLLGIEGGEPLVCISIGRQLFGRDINRLAGSWEK